jgi:hypothetical protein
MFPNSGLGNTLYHFMRPVIFVTFRMFHSCANHPWNIQEVAEEIQQITSSGDTRKHEK